MHFEILGEIEEVEVIAKGASLRERGRLRKLHGKGPWRKLKGIARIKLHDGEICTAEIHWYEAHGIGKEEFKIKRILE